MTKKAKTKTKSDEAPPQAAPPEEQSAEAGAGQKAEAAAPQPQPQPQPPTPAAAAPQPVPQPPAEAAKPPGSPAAAAPAPPPDTKSGDAKSPEPPLAAAQAPAALSAAGSPPEKSPIAQLPAQLGVASSQPEKPHPASVPPQSGTVSSPGAVGSPLQKSPAVQAPAQQKAVSSPPEKPPAAQALPPLGVQGSVPEKSPAAQGPPQSGVVGSPGEKPPAPKQENAPDKEPKPSGPVQSEPRKEQPTTPQPNSQNLPQPPLGDLSLSPTSSDKTREASTDKPQIAKDSKPIAPPKSQDTKKEPADKNQKVAPTTPKVASNGQPSKQPAEKENKRQVTKESVPSNSTQKGNPSVNKPSGLANKQNSDKVLDKPEPSSESKTEKDNTAENVGEIPPSQVKEEPNKNQLSGATSKTSIKQNSANGASKKLADAEIPTPKDSNKNIAAAVTENAKSVEKSETPKDPTADKKVAEQKVVPDQAKQGNQQKSSPKSEPSDKGNKNAPSKKNKQKNEATGSKTEGAPNSKEVKPSEKGGKKDTTTVATPAQPTPKVNEAPPLPTATDTLKTPTSDTVSKLPTVEAVAPDHSAQVKEGSNKLKEQPKNTAESKDSKEGAIKNDAQSKSSSKKKNRQQKKSVSEDVKPSEVNDNKGPQEVSKLKNNEKKKAAPAAPSKEKESGRAAASAPGEKILKNTPGENVTAAPKVSQGKSPAAEKAPTAEKDSSDKSQEVITSESQPEEQGASKKKKRNRHKKKNKAGDAENCVDANAESGKQQDTAVGGERKVKEKQQTTTPPTNKSKGQQKDSQPGQTNTRKGTQPASAKTQDGQTSGETPAKPASDTTGQTASAKKRNRRKKKAALEIEKDSSASLQQESKSAESKETPGAKPEEKKTPPAQMKTNETPKKKTDSKPTPKLEKPQQQDGQFTEGSEDQSDNFVEVKSKSKRNKKKKLDSAETKDELTSANNVSKVIPESTVDSSVSSSKGKVETENASGDSVKEATNKVAALKISQEAREQKMLNKRLAERAQLKIQKQIESNALSEVEKSEKFLENITKNLKELTKLRSSKLEDVLQKAGDEEFDYEYTPVQRTTFLATTCHVCKESKQREAMKVCEKCHLMSYCSEDHQKSDWSAHKDLCQAISEMCKERGTGHLYAPTVGLSAEEYRGYRMNALLECSAILNRQLEPYEQEIILYPNVCHTCHVPTPSLHTCESCSMVSYCSPEHRPPNHDVWCHDLQLYKSLIIYQSRNGVINPQLPVFLPESFQPLSGDMQSDLRTLSGGADASPLERAVLSEIATGPLTALFALQKSNRVSGTTEKLVIHFVGAEWSFEMERADKWEAFLMHLIPSLKVLTLVFVGPEVCNLPPEAHGLVQKQSTPCPQCQEKSRKVEVVIPPQAFYHEYVASQDFITPSIICAYNAGLYRPKGHKDVDSWSDTVPALLRDPGVPVAVTSYTAEEVLKDAERLQLHRPLNFVLPPSQNPYRSLRPNRNFASDDVSPVIFKNYYIMIATSLTQ